MSNTKGRYTSSVGSMRRSKQLALAFRIILAIVMLMWGLMVVARTLVTSERMVPWVAGWLPFAVLAVSAFVMWLRREGRMGWRGT